jgi:SNF2 family DNA or RNA helicase
LARDKLLVSFSPGTGKTRIVWETIRRLSSQSNRPRFLYAVPNSLVEQTLEEAHKWLPQEICAQNLPLYGSISVQDRALLLKHDTTWQTAVISHESLSFASVRTALGTLRFNAIFLDEASRFRNHSKRTKTLLTLRADKKVALSGTMIVKSPADVWYVMKWLDPNWCGITRRELFNAEYCILGGYTGTDPLDVRPDKVDQLNEQLDRFRISCTLSDIRDMPRRVSSVRYVDMTPEQGRYYAELRDTLKLEIERESDVSFELRVNNYVGRLQRLQEICAGFARNTGGDCVPIRSGKAPEIYEILRDRVPTIVWTWWRPEYASLLGGLREQGFRAAGLAEDGGREAFLSNRADILVANIAAGGYGLNLDRAERMIFHSLYWGADVMAQALDRNWRMTTEADKYVIYLVCRGTIDEYVREKLAGRADMSRKLSRSEALELLT